MELQPDPAVTPAWALPEPQRGSTSGGSCPSLRLPAKAQLYLGQFSPHLPPLSFPQNAPTLLRALETRTGRGGTATLCNVTAEAKLSKRAEQRAVCKRKSFSQQMQGTSSLPPVQLFPRHVDAGVHGVDHLGMAKGAGRGGGEGRVCVSGALLPGARRSAQRRPCWPNKPQQHGAAQGQPPTSSSGS